MESIKYSSFFDTEKLKGDLKHQAIRGGMISSACQVILFILRLSSIVVLARLLIPEHFGLIGMVTALTVFIERFEDLGLGDAVVQREKISHEQVSTLFWLNIGICFSLAVLVALCAKAVAWFYNDPRLVWITIALASNFIFSGVSIQHNALIRRRMRFDHFALIKIISTTGSLILAITLALMGFGYWALVWKEISRSLLIAVLAWSFCSWRPGLPVRNSGVKSMLKFGGNITGYNFLYYLSNNLDSILLGKFFGAVPVGFYSRAKQLAAIPIMPLLDPMQYVSLPALSALQNDPIGYRKYFEKMLAILSFLYMPIIVYIGLYSRPIVLIALGPQWMDTVLIYRFMAISAFFSPLVVMLGLIMVSSGQSKRYFFWGLFTSLATIMAFIIGLKWGVIGVAASWGIASFLNFIYSLFFVFKGSPVSSASAIKSIYRPIIASVIMGCALLFTYERFSVLHIALKMCLSISLGAAIYLVIWMIFPGGYKNMIEFACYPLSVLKRKNAI